MQELYTIPSRFVNKPLGWAGGNAQLKSPETHFFPL